MCKGKKKKDPVADNNACYLSGKYYMLDMSDLSHGSHPNDKYVRRVMARKMAEIPQPIYVMKVRMVAWTRLIIGSLERSCTKTTKKEVTAHWH